MMIEWISLNHKLNSSFTLALTLWIVSTHRLKLLLSISSQLANTSIILHTLLLILRSVQISSRNCRGYPLLWLGSFPTICLCFVKYYWITRLAKPIDEAFDFTRLSLAGGARRLWFFTIFIIDPGNELRVFFHVFVQRWSCLGSRYRLD